MRVRYNVNAEPQSGKLKLIDGTDLCLWPESLAISFLREIVDVAYSKIGSFMNLFRVNGMTDDVVHFAESQGCWDTAARYETMCYSCTFHFVMFSTAAKLHMRRIVRGDASQSQCKATSEKGGASIPNAA